jgi:hypothetical protein
MGSLLIEMMGTMMKRYIELVGEGIHGIEFVVYAVLGGLLVAVGPPIWFYRLLANHHAAMASVVGGCWVGSVFAVARDAKQSGDCAFVGAFPCLAGRAGLRLSQFTLFLNANFR